VVPFGDDADGADAAYWLSDKPASPELWVQLHRTHPHSSLRPVLAASFYADPDRTWADGEVSPEPDIDALEVLASLWAAYGPARSGTSCRSWIRSAAAGRVLPQPTERGKIRKPLLTSTCAATGATGHG
jgi:hypothetical protein